MGFNCNQWFAGLRFPCTYRFVVTCAGEGFAVGAERNTVHKVRMPRAHRNLFEICRHIEYTQLTKGSRRPPGLSKARPFLVPDQRMDRPDRLKESSIDLPVDYVPEKNYLVSAHRQRFAVRTKCQRL